MTRIYYWKNEHAHTLLMGWAYLEAQNPELATKLRQHYLDDTHILLIEREDSKDLEELFMYYQGEMWSPNGEATPLIKEKKLGHTSMSVGDIIEQNDKFFFCDTLGFKEI
jgi:hypothetical protein